MRQISTSCDACGKVIRQRDWMQVTVSGNHREETTFDICRECAPLMERGITIGLRMVTNGNGKRLTIVEEA